MKRRAIYLASTALGAALVASGSAWAQMANGGSFCSTPVKICELSHASWIGNGCSCRVPGGRARGSVTSGYGNPPSAYNNPLGGMFAAVAAPVEAVASVPVAAAEATTAPLMSGRSVATGEMGNYCTTPTKTCELYHGSWIGNGCSCRAPGGRARGSVTP
jgi:hypothetical protein